MEQALLGIDGEGGLLRDFRGLREEVKDEFVKTQERWDRLVLGLVLGTLLLIASAVVSQALIA